MKLPLHYCLFQDLSYIIEQISEDKDDSGKKPVASLIQIKTNSRCVYFMKKMMLLVTVLAIILLIVFKVFHV